MNGYSLQPEAQIIHKSYEKIIALQFCLGLRECDVA